MHTCGFVHMPDLTLPRAEAPTSEAAPLEHVRDDWRGAALAASLDTFQRAHGALLGSRPFLRGLRVWLEAQRGDAAPLVWRLRPEALTQAGGPEWTRDAVALLRAHAVRRPELELRRPDGSVLPEWCVRACSLLASCRTATRLLTLKRRLVWALPHGFGDDDVRAALAALPPHATLADVNPTGDVAPDTSPSALPRARVAPQASHTLRLCCCFGPPLLSL